jgi:putative ABC transport system permease protein
MNTLFDRDSWREIILTLEQKPWRTILTAFGVFWGIFMLALLIGTGQGLKTGAFQMFQDFATNSIFIWPERTTVPYKGLPRNREYSFTVEDMDAIMDLVKGIRYLVPQVRQGAAMTRGTQKGNYTVNGSFPEINLIDPVDVSLGRFINHIDLEQKRKVVVIGKTVHANLFKSGENPLGRYIRISGAEYEVVGVFRSLHDGGWAEWQNGLSFMPLSTMQQAFNLGNRIGFLGIEADAGKSATALGKEVESVLRERHKIAPEDKLAFGEENIEDQYLKLTYLFAGISALIWVIGIGTLLSGIIGVSNIMLFTVKARTHEIGIRRVLGAAPAAVMAQILMESLLLTASAGIFGLCLGVLVISRLNGIEAQTFRHPDIPMAAALSSLAIIIVSGLASGLLPAYRAVSLKPIEAIRDIG